MMQTDVKGATCAANGTTTAFNGRTRLRGIAINAGTAAATVVVKDGSTTLFTFTATTTGPMNVIIPGEGVLCETSLVIVCSAGVSAVAFYG
jgi:hypothetical protein